MLKLKFYIICVVMYVINYVQSANLRIDPLVLISQGIVQGQRATDGDYIKFLGIPYAVVDEDNPFGPSLPPKQFDEEVYKAYNGEFKCPQTPMFDVNEDENETLDCLRLNIYVPNVATSQNPLPILVFIHGGGFSGGSGGEVGVRDLVKQGIVVVTVNYRLGPYGFMCLNVPRVPGNQGLKDQFTALRWIRNNIRSFGGNPYNVTLAGQSAGAGSVLLHLYSSNEKLFHKVIAQSGTPENYGMFINADSQVAIKLANHLGLRTTDTSEALDFLAKIPHRLVTGAVSDLNIDLKPCKEQSFDGIENFIDSDPHFLTNERKIRDTPILIGVTSKEERGSRSITSDYFNSDPFLNRISNYFNIDSDKLSSVGSTFRHYYIGDKAINEEVKSMLEDFESDFFFNHPVERTVTSLLRDNANPLFQYVFSYVGDSEVEGASHGSEMNYIFNMAALAYGAQRSDEQAVSDYMVTLWGNFIKFGNPTPQGRNTLPVTWDPVTSDSRPYLNIDKTLQMESRALNERMAFWDLFYEHYGLNYKVE